MTLLRTWSALLVLAFAERLAALAGWLYHSDHRYRVTCIDCAAFDRAAAYTTGLADGTRQGLALGRAMRVAGMRVERPVTEGEA
mgnify:CR=1 FL=1